MSNKQSQESHGYTEGITVKISERYKPPPRINLVMTYSQRLNLNKQIQDSLPNYEFVLEKAVKERMKEWRNSRSIQLEQRQSRLEKARELKEKQRLEAERIRREREEVEVSGVSDIPAETDFDTTKIEYPSASSSDTLYNSVPPGTYGNQYSDNSLLIPTQASISSYSNILTPMPLTTDNYTTKLADKSPFNISDFEADTSSPFDSMELKSINDMEELAQVLKTDDTYKPVNQTPYYSTYQPMQSLPQNVSTYPTYPVIGNQYNYDIPCAITYSQPQPVMSNFSNTNGYYYHPPDNIQQVQSCSNSYSYMPYNDQNVASDVSSFSESKKLFRSVPDIMQELETELVNTHLDKTQINSHSSVDKSCNVTTPTRPKSSNMVYPKAKKKEEDLDDPYFSLPKNLQELSRSISLMGFPLPRVARTCKQLGNDHKKIVEHLLAMTELLDLGFSEKDVSGALLACNNDRDKALDKLIS